MNGFDIFKMRYFYYDRNKEIMNNLPPEIIFLDIDWFKIKQGFTIM